MRGDALLECVCEQAGDGGGDGNQDPEQERDDEAGYGRRFQRDGNRRVVEVAVESVAEVSDGLDAVQDGRGEQEGKDRERGDGDQEDRSEERRVGKECRSRWSPY